MKFSIERPKFQVYSTEEMVEELCNVAKHYNFRRFSRREFDEISTACKGSSVLNRFGTWQAALDATGLTLKEEKRSTLFITNQQLFSEMERIWSEIGHRPSHDEWVSQNPKYSYSTYKARFNGWVNACKAFVNFVTGEECEELPPPAKRNGSENTKRKRVKTDIRKRGVSDKLRYQVLSRDKFKCVHCGRSPANEAGVKLHIDHIVPFSKGGKTEIENLRSLCNRCNWGKGDAIEQNP